MFGEKDKEEAIRYANQENNLNNTNNRGIVKIIMNNDLKIYEVLPFSITRITIEQIRELQKQGYDLISGRMLGKIEYVLLNKNKIIEIQFEPVLQNSRKDDGWERD